MFGGPLDAGGTLAIACQRDVVDGSDSRAFLALLRFHDVLYTVSLHPISTTVNFTLPSLTPAELCRCQRKMCLHY